MNYLSEMTAILATLLSCPAQAHINTWTDCLSAKQAIQRDDCAERARIRAAARPILTCIRRAIRCRNRLGARTSFQHVRSHTNGSSFEEKGNAMADVRANSERVEALNCESVPFLTGEEMFTAWIPDTRGRMGHVIGDVRKALKRSVKRKILDRWCALPHQGLTPKTNPDGAVLLCKLVRGQSSSALLRFAVLALCQWLPSGRYRGRQRREDKLRSGRWSCPSCPFAGHETSRHAILCPVRRSYLREAADRAHSLAMEAAEATFGETTTLPQDHSRRSFRLLRHEPRPGVTVNALASLCRSGPARDPHQALLGLCRSSAAPCSCHSGTCHAHGWRPPPGTLAKLRSRLALETELFAQPGRVSPDFLQWYTLDPEGSLVGSSGSPWDCTWEGMFALCAPCLSPGAGPGVVDRILVKAHHAVSGPRPTRIVLLVDRSVSLADSPSEYKLVGDAKVLIIENTAASALSSSMVKGRMPQALPMRWGGPANSPIPAAPLVPSWHPLAAVSFPDWLTSSCRETANAFRAFGAHDRYASSLGIPARNFSLVLACHMDGRDRPSARSRSAADRAVPVAMLALLKGAHKAWAHSCECRRVWWRQMDDSVMDSEIELRQLRLHQRGQALRKRKYECQISRKAAKRRRIAHLNAIAGHLGMTRPALVAWRPDCLEGIPADLAALAPPPLAPSWSGTLRANPPSARVSLCDDYVGDDRTRRRLPFRSLRRERAAIARRCGR
jgi:hypothetical protein